MRKPIENIRKQNLIVKKNTKWKPRLNSRLNCWSKDLDPLKQPYYRIIYNNLKYSYGGSRFAILMRQWYNRHYYKDKSNRKKSKGFIRVNWAHKHQQ